MRHVIIGAGPAGVSAAETLRRLDPGGSVVLLGKEPEPPYSRMALPYFLTGNITDSGTHLRKTAGHYESLNIQYRQGAAASVDPGKSRVTLQDGGAVGYDKLLIAAGARPVRPPVEGLDLPGVHHCWTLADAREIIKLAGDGREVVLMGAGFIGCIILESLVKRKVNLTVVEMADRMLARMMNDTGARMMRSWCEARGVTVKTGAEVTGITEGSGAAPLSVVLKGGAELPAHLVVVAAGVKANTDFLEGSGVKVEEGAVTDDRLKTSADNIYAAGDCAQGPDFSTGGWSVHAIQPTGAEHGRTAAANMAGRDARYKGSLNMNVLDTIGLITSSFGAWEGVPGGDSSESLDEENSRYMRLEFKDDVLAGALSLGRTDHIGCLRGLIHSRVRLGRWKDKLMRDPQLLAEAYVARTSPA